MKKDAARNRHYAYAGIPCIVLNTKEIRSTGMIPAAYLDKELEKIGMAKPAGSTPHFPPDHDVEVLRVCRRTMHAATQFRQNPGARWRLPPCCTTRQPVQARIGLVIRWRRI